MIPGVIQTGFGLHQASWTRKSVPVNYGAPVNYRAVEAGVSCVRWHALEDAPLAVTARPTRSDRGERGASP